MTPTEAQVAAAANVFYDSQTGTTGLLATSGWADSWRGIARAALAAAEEAGPWEWGVHHVQVDGWVSARPHPSRESAESDFATCGMHCTIARRRPERPAGPWEPFPSTGTTTEEE